MDLKRLTELRGAVNRRTALILSTSGLVLILGTWVVVTGLKWIPRQILPAPWQVLSAFVELHFHDALVRNMGYSIYINVLGYVQAIVVSLVLGFFLGLSPLARNLFSKWVNATRFIPMTAVTGLFIAIFGIETNMRVQFLAFGIIVYMLPVVIQRIDEVEAVLDQTAITLGATMWQRIRTVFIPAVICRISDDIRVLVAISWTYIIVAEMINSKAGLGYLCFLASKSSRIDKAYAVLIVIVLVGFIQDKFLETLDRKLFRFKYL